MVANYTVKGAVVCGGQVPSVVRKLLASTDLGANCDLGADGKRFVVLMPAESPQPQEMQNHLTLVVNFFDEIRRRVAAQSK